MYIYIGAYIHVHIGAFYYLLGNISPRLRSKISSIQLLLLVKYDSIIKVGIETVLQPFIEDIQRLESVSMHASSLQIVVVPKLNESFHCRMKEFLSWLKEKL